LATGTALTKAIDTGAGDDTVTFVAAVTGSSATLSGGDGTDTLAMAVANAATLDASAQSFYTNFERLSLTDAGAGGETIDLANLGFANYVTTAGSAGTLTLDKLASGGTVVQTVAPAAGITVGVADAATGTADVVNLVLQNDATTNFLTTTVANVETVNITSTDIFVDANKDGKDDTDGDHTLILAADKATAVTVSGDALALSVTGATALATVDASATTESFSYTADDGTTTVTGGSGVDTLVAAGSGDTLIGGAGNDVLTGADLTTLTGGAGNDTFVLANVPTNVNTYSSITDLATGDIIDLDAGNVGSVVFKSAGIDLAPTAVFQDYANAAVNALGTDVDDAAWFQFSGNTYIVKSGGDHTATPDFQNGQDSIIQITGVVDLATASYNQTNGTLEIA